MAWYDEDEDEYGDTDFDPDNLEGEDITDLDQLYEFADMYDGEWDVYEFHGTGDTGGAD